MYRFQLEYDFEDMLILNRVAAKVNRRIIMSILYVFVFCAGLFVMLAGVAMLLLAYDMFRGILLLVIGLIYLAIALFHQRINAWRSKKMLLKGVGELTVVLDEEGVSEHSAKFDAQYPWNVFIGGYYCKERCLLFLDKCHAIILPKRALIEGNLAELSAFLENKLQKKIREIR